MLPDWARERPDYIRDALTEKHVAADSNLAQFVGIKPYEAAGGAVLRDLFDDDNSGWLTGVNPLSAVAKGPNHSWRSQHSKARLRRNTSWRRCAAERTSKERGNAFEGTRVALAWMR